MTNLRLGDSPLEGAKTKLEDFYKLFDGLRNAPIGITNVGGSHVEITEDTVDKTYMKEVALVSDKTPGEKIFAYLHDTPGTAAGLSLSVAFRDATGEVTHLTGENHEPEPFDYDVYVKLMTALGSAPSAEEIKMRRQEAAIHKAAADQVHATTEGTIA